MRNTRHVGRMLAGAIACASVLAVASCNQVGDSLTGVDLNRTVTSTCLGECRSDYNDAVSAEKKRHAVQNEACRALEQPDRNTCLEAEDALNRLNLIQLKSELTDCQNNCHRQGSGSGS